MLEFFEEIKNFLQSEYAKDNRVVIAVLVITFVVATICVVSLIFNKLIIPFKLRESGDIMVDYQRVLAENEKLKEELKYYRNIKGMLEAINSEDLGMPEDKAVDSFLRKRK